MSNSIPENVLAGSEKILLRDLLDSPTFRPWIVSALCNGVNTAYDLGLSLDNEDDQFLQFKLKQMTRAIPHEARRECFDTTARLIRERKEGREKRITDHSRTGGAFQ
jgi:hypothetical protein